MPVPSLLEPFIGPLERLGAPYCVTGSVASSVYGQPRLTADIDVVMLLDLRSIPALLRVFPAHEYYVPPEEMLRDQLDGGARRMFNLIHHASQFKADIYVAGADPLHGWALRHRRRIDVDGDAMWLAPPEYVIVRKLEYYLEGRSNKHLRDVRSILAATEVDRAFIAAEVERRALTAAWRDGGFDD
jgi:hypothetical protein